MGRGRRIGRGSSPDPPLSVSGPGNKETGAAKAVSEVFRGEVNQKVDAKARVSIPAAFRRVLETGDPAFPDSPRPKFVIVYGDDRRRFVECYTIAEMKRVEALIARLPRGSARRRILERNLITLSVTVEVDDDGRIVLPQKARDKTGITADDLRDGVEATFAGTLDTFQIWKRETYEAEIAAQADLALEELGEDDMLALLPDPEA
jgi:MraZ protein